MTTFVRFRNLRDRGIVDNWMTLRRWIKERDFPPGRLLAPNTRVWTDEEIETWLGSRPTAAKPVKRGRPRKPTPTATDAAEDHTGA